MSNRFQRRVLQDAFDDPEPLTDWEYDRVQEWMEKEEDYEFSELQNKVINQISQKYI